MASIKRLILFAPLLPLSGCCDCSDRAMPVGEAHVVSVQSNFSNNITVRYKSIKYAAFCWQNDEIVARETTFNAYYEKSITLFMENPDDNLVEVLYNGNVRTYEATRDEVLVHITDFISNG